MHYIMLLRVFVTEQRKKYHDLSGINMKVRLDLYNVSCMKVSLLTLVAA